MKLILSRKGFDGASGGYPSPIMPDGTLLSLPIPDAADLNRLSELMYDGQSYLDILNSIAPKYKMGDLCHLDPDLRADLRPRAQGWRPALGQMGSAYSHLRNRGVEPGDIFLFLGKFQETEIVDGKLRYKKGSKPKHVLFGYLQVGEIVTDPAAAPAWLAEHPHMQPKYADDWAKGGNAIYLSADRLSFLPSLPGAGVFDYRPDLVLTKDGHSASHWDLPDCFRDVEISYHPAKRWHADYLQSVGRGQEFVMDATPAILDWLKARIQG